MSPFRNDFLSLYTLLVSWVWRRIYIYIWCIHSETTFWHPRHIMCIQSEAAFRHPTHIWCIHSETTFWYPTHIWCIQSEIQSETTLWHATQQGKKDKKGEGAGDETTQKAGHYAKSTTLFRALQEEALGTISGCVLLRGAGWCRVVRGGAMWCCAVLCGAMWYCVVLGGAGSCRVV